MLKLTFVKNDDDDYNNNNKSNCVTTLFAYQSVVLH